MERRRFNGNSGRAVIRVKHGAVMDNNGVDLTSQYALLSIEVRSPRRTLQVSGLGEWFSRADSQYGQIGASVPLS